MKADKTLRDDIKNTIRNLYKSPEELTDEILSLLKQKLEEAVGEEKPKTELNLKSPNLYQYVEGYNQKREEVEKAIKELLK